MPISSSTSSHRSFRRVLLKISGEALREAGAADNISMSILGDLVKQIAAAHAQGVQIAIVVGGGNFWRGVTGQNALIDRVSADQIGMMATVMNSLAVQAALESAGVPAVVLSALEVKGVAAAASARSAHQELNAGKVVVFAAGTGNPFFSTDSAAALRASEIRADVVFKATKVDGVYNKDPKKHADAVRYDTLSFDEALAKRLDVMDHTAFALCREHRIAIIVFDMTGEGNIQRALLGEPLGTVVSNA